MTALDGQARNSQGTFTRSLEAIDRDRRAAQLVIQGYTYQEAADALGYSDRADCHRGVKRVRAEAAQLDGTTEEMRQQLLGEMHALRRRLWDRLKKPLPALDRLGRTCHDDNGNVVPDAAAIAAAEAMIIKTNQRIAAIRGVDAPKRSISLTGRAGVQEILAVIEAASPEDLAEAIAVRRRELERARKEAAETDARNAIAGAVEPWEP